MRSKAIQEGNKTTGSVLLRLSGSYRFTPYSLLIPAFPAISQVHPSVRTLVIQGCLLENQHPFSVKGVGKSYRKARFVRSKGIQLSE